jgi:hypothetical protein
MNPTVINGSLHQFSAKAPKDGKLAIITGKLCVTEEPELLAGLCSWPAKAKKAVIAAEDADGKVELLCDEEEASASISDTLDVAITTDMTCNKVICNFAGELPAHELHFSVPFALPLAMYFMEHLGNTIQVAINPAQQRLPGTE